MIGVGRIPIVAVASTDATVAEQQLATYFETKGTVRPLVRTVAMDHGRQGVRVNILRPSPMMAGPFKRHTRSTTDPDNFDVPHSNRRPDGLILQICEVASVALFLLSKASTALKGTEVCPAVCLTTKFDFWRGRACFGLIRLGGRARRHRSRIRERRSNAKLITSPVICGKHPLPRKLAEKAKI